MPMPMPMPMQDAAPVRMPDVPLQPNPLHWAAGQRRRAKSPESPRAVPDVPSPSLGRALSRPTKDKGSTGMAGNLSLFSQSLFDSPPTSPRSPSPSPSPSPEHPRALRALSPSPQAPEATAALACTPPPAPPRSRSRSRAEPPVVAHAPALPSRSSGDNLVGPLSPLLAPPAAMSPRRAAAAVSRTLGGPTPARRGSGSTRPLPPTSCAAASTTTTTRTPAATTTTTTVTTTTAVTTATTTTTSTSTAPAPTAKLAMPSPPVGALKRKGTEPSSRGESLAQAPRPVAVSSATAAKELITLTPKAERGTALPAMHPSRSAPSLGLGAKGTAALDAPAAPSTSTSTSTSSSSGARASGRRAEQVGKGDLLGLGVEQERVLTLLHGARCRLRRRLRQPWWGVRVPESRRGLANRCLRRRDKRI
eukprot:gnl/Trimastix_PCT/1833.p1 GENE.gnl/Trimastix_PCT/1833~~gnl/Trimastix_PCT/1833.p1  ORF type:complete len:420 (-),score=42.40 gnl/Trimastix_PCT/1833:510-1769(-)